MRGQSQRGLGRRILEKAPIRGQSVDMRCLDVRVAVTHDAVDPGRVQGEKEDVGIRERARPFLEKALIQPEIDQKADGGNACGPEQEAASGLPFAGRIFLMIALGGHYFYFLRFSMISLTWAAWGAFGSSWRKVSNDLMASSFRP